MNGFVYERNTIGRHISVGILMWYVPWCEKEGCVIGVYLALKSPASCTSYTKRSLPFDQNVRKGDLCYKPQRNCCREVDRDVVLAPKREFDTKLSITIYRQIPGGVLLTGFLRRALPLSLITPGDRTISNLPRHFVIKKPVKIFSLPKLQIRCYQYIPMASRIETLSCSYDHDMGCSLKLHQKCPTHGS